MALMGRHYANRLLWSTKRVKNLSNLSVERIDNNFILMCNLVC